MRCLGRQRKIAAAARVGRTHVIIPAANANIINEMPADLIAKVEIHPVATAKEALALALGQ